MVPEAPTRSAARPRVARLGFVGVAIALLASGCWGGSSESERTQSAQEYFAHNNAAARQGPGAQQQFFDDTQHPDFTAQVCELDGLTVTLAPALTTLRPDPGFAPTGTSPPRGDLWVVGVEVTTRRSGTVIGRQIGSLHLAFLDHHVFGFAPCPSQ